MNNRGAAAAAARHVRVLVSPCDARCLAVYRRHAFAAVALAAAAPPPAWLVSLRHTHLHKVSVLRGFPSGSLLRYGSDGSLLAAGPPLPWTEAAFRPEWIDLHHDYLEIAGYRCLLVFEDGKLAWGAVALPNRIRLEVSLPPLPLDPTGAEHLWTRIFMNDADLVRAAPPYWHAFLTGGVRLTHLPHDRFDARLATDPAHTARVAPTPAAPSKTAPPRTIRDPNPQYTTMARQARVQGSVLIRITVGADGAPHDPIILKPLGAGLDEAAIETLKQWRFRPAQKNGRPIAAFANVAVNFQFY